MRKVSKFLSLENSIIEKISKAGQKDLKGGFHPSVEFGCPPETGVKI